MTTSTASGASGALSQTELKRLVARAALDYVVPGEVLGVGTGSTVDQLIDQLPEIRDRIPACVSSSERSTKRLEALGFRVVDLNEVDSIGVYIDGADEIDPGFSMIKGGGGALTREKIVASVAGKFVCIADASKRVEVLGRFPLRRGDSDGRRGRSPPPRGSRRYGEAARLRHGQRLQHPRRLGPLDQGSRRP